MHHATFSLATHWEYQVDREGQGRAGYCRKPVGCEHKSGRPEGQASHPAGHSLRDSHLPAGPQPQGRRGRALIRSEVTGIGWRCSFSAVLSPGCSTGKALDHWTANQCSTSSQHHYSRIARPHGHPLNQRVTFEVPQTTPSSAIQADHDLSSNARE